MSGSELVENRYPLQNAGKRRFIGIISIIPTEQENQPVTGLNVRDIIVWLNALSEMTGLIPVYRTEDGRSSVILEMKTDLYVDQAIQTDYTGYRLPTSDEWEMAARWTNEIEESPHTIIVGTVLDEADMPVVRFSIMT